MTRLLAILIIAVPLFASEPEVKQPSADAAQEALKVTETERADHLEKRLLLAQMQLNRCLSKAIPPEEAKLMNEVRQEVQQLGVKYKVPNGMILNTDGTFGKVQ